MTCFVASVGYAVLATRMGGQGAGVDAGGYGGEACGGAAHPVAKQEDEGRHQAAGARCGNRAAQPADDEGEAVGDSSGR